MPMGERLRKLLKERHMTQTQLAKKLDISASTLNGYITGYREPDMQMLSLLAKELDTTTDYLISGGDTATQTGDAQYHDRVKVIAHNEGVTLTTEQEAAVTKYMSFLLAEDSGNGK